MDENSNLPRGFQLITTEDPPDDPEGIVKTAFGGLQRDPPLADVEMALRDLVESVNGADGLRRMIVSNYALDALNDLGVNRAASIVKAAFSGRSGETKKGGAPSGIAALFSDPDPWDEPVDGSQLLDDIETVYKRYFALPPGASVILSVWTLGTWVFDAFDLWPRLLITSAVKRSGKTNLMTVAKSLVARPLPTSNVSPAAIFRSIESYSPTVMIDESDRSLKNNEELCGIVNASHTRAYAFVLRVAGEELEPTPFSCWAPIAIAMIGRPMDTITDRSVHIRMRRRAPGERVDRFRETHLKRDLEPIRQMCARWAADKTDALREAGPPPDFPELGNDRARDNLEPLVNIADAAGGEWPTKVR